MLDNNATTRSKLDKDTRRHVVSIVQRDSPERIQWLVVASPSDYCRAVVK